MWGRKIQDQVFATNWKKKKMKEDKVQDLLWPEAKRVIPDAGDYRPSF